MDATSLPRERVDAAPGDPAASWPGAAVSGRERLLAPPRWLRDLGTSAWLITGIALVTLAAISLMALTRTIVMPVITAGVIAAVASPIVGWLERHGVARLLGAVIVLLGFLVAAALLVVMVVGGVLSQ